MPRSGTLPALVALCALLTIAVALVLVARDSEPAAALAFVVTRTDDPEPNGCLPNDCSLREAVIATNDPAIGPDLIDLPAGTYLLTRNGGVSTANFGDLDVNDDLAIHGEGAGNTIIDASAIDDRIFDFNEYVTPAVLMDLTLRNGHPTDGDGGIIRNAGQLQLENVVVENGETATNGGAIASSYHLTLIDSVIRESEAGGFGGGIFSTERLTLSDSTVSGNSAEADGGGIAASQTSGTGGNTISGATISSNDARSGGGMLLFGGASLNVTNSTISGNTARELGGGIANTGGASAGLASATITDNRADTNGDTIGGAGGLFGLYTLRNTIVAGNTDPNGDADCFGTVTSEAYNLIGMTSPNCTVEGDTTGNLSGDPGIGPLVDGGGLTKTHPPFDISQARNAGNPAGCNAATGGALTKDQRGANRNEEGRCDIGAFEYGAIPPTPTPSPTPTPKPPTPTATATPTPAATTTPAPGECPDSTPEPTPTPIPSFNLLLTYLYACNDTGMPAKGIHVWVTAAANLLVLVSNAPGCPEPDITFSPPVPDPLYGGVELHWAKACVDPGETVVLRFNSDCPGCPATVDSFSWLLETTPTPTPGDCRLSSTPTPIATPTPTSTGPTPKAGWPITLASVCNTTEAAASDLHLSVDQREPDAVMWEEVPGCPKPTITSGGFMVTVDWGVACVDPGERAVIGLSTFPNCFDCIVQFLTHEWSFPPKAMQGDTDCDKDADAEDGLNVLRDVAGFPPSKCIEQGDTDCDEDRDSVDALGILRFVAALPPLPQHEPCADIGTPI